MMKREWVSIRIVLLEIFNQETILINPCCPYSKFWQKTIYFNPCCLLRELWPKDYSLTDIVFLRKLWQKDNTVWSILSFKEILMNRNCGSADVIFLENLMKRSNRSIHILWCLSFQQMTIPFNAYCPIDFNAYSVLGNFWPKDNNVEPILPFKKILS